MTIRWGLIGCGDIARKRVARAIIDQPQSCLLAACRRDETKLREFCRPFGVERAYTRDTDLLRDPDIDAVYLATPVALHLPQTLAAAAAGKHVLVEKPMALTVAECDRMIAACAKYGVNLGVAYYRRFYPIVTRMKRLLTEGAIGRPLAVSAVTSTPFAIGPRDEGYWRVVLAEGGGGALMDIGSHRLNLFLDLFGEPVDVHATANTLLGTYEAEDCVTVTLRFPQGVHGTLQCFFGPTYVMDDFTIIGTTGRLRASPLNGSKLVVDRGDEEQHIEIHPPAVNLHGPLICDFVASIIDRREPLVAGEEARRTNAVMERAYRAARKEGS